MQNLLDDENHLKSFVSMMHSKVICMQYTPCMSTWNEINHYLPCIGIPSYSYVPSESLQLCEKILEKLSSIKFLLRDDIFLIGKIKTGKMIQEYMQKHTKTKKQRVIVVKHYQREDDCEQIHPSTDEHDDAEIIGSDADDAEVIGSDVNSESGASVDESEDIWMNDDEIEEMMKQTEKRILDRCVPEEEW